MTNSQDRRAPAFAPVLVAALLLATLAGAQQPNTPQAALSINGTGRVDASGAVFATNSELFPTPLGSAPFFHHRAMARSPLGFRIDGISGNPIILVTGPVAAAATPVSAGPGFPPDLFELDLAQTTVLLDGFNATTIFDLGALIGPSGAWTFGIPLGVPDGFPTVSFQGIVVDPTAPSGTGFRFTAAVTLETANDLDALAANVVDASFLAFEDPTYLTGLTSTDFLNDGLDASLEAYSSLLDVQGLAGDPAVAFLLLESIGPDATNQPSLPTGAPAPGQVVPFSIDVRDARFSDCPFLLYGSRSREYGQQAREEAGVWKWRGNQRDVAIDVTLCTLPAPGLNPQGLDVLLDFAVSDPIGRNGGVDSVTVTGPQLAGLGTSGTAFTSATGTIALDFAGGGPLLDDPSDWSGFVLLGASGSSRMPLVENGVGPRDVYNVTVNWFDGTFSGPYAIPLRAAFDFQTQSASVTAAMPGVFGPLTTTLFNAGGVNAELDVTLDLGAFPNPGLHGGFAFGFSGGAPGQEFSIGVPTLELNPITGVQTLTFCLPFVQSGDLTGMTPLRVDLFGNFYGPDLGINP